MADAKDTAERRTLKMHPRLLWDIITRQAGTKEKAILEAVQNSIDAGTDRIDIKLNADSFTISDNGKGFKDRNEIEDFFETFGFPHEDGDAKFGRYRMGRGQLFCFGVNEWRSNDFHMVIDLKPQGPAERRDKKNETLGYDLRALDVPRPGCEIEVRLYDSMLPGDIHRATRGIEDFVKYVDIPVLLNGKTINTPPADRKWSKVTDDGYFHFAEKSTLTVYNMGVLVREYPSHLYGGIGGVVVSKERLDVNFARNDVIGTCPAWKRIQAVMRQQAGVTRKKKTKLTDSDIEAMATEILSCELPWDQALDAKVLTDVTGAHQPLSKLIHPHVFKNRIVAVEMGDRRGDKAMQAGNALVLARTTLGRFGVKTTEELVTVLSDVLARIAPDTNHPLEAASRTQAKGRRKAVTSLDDAVEAARAPGYKPENAKRHPWDVGNLLRALPTLRHVTDAELSKLYSNAHEIVPRKDLTKLEQVVQTSLQNAADAIHKELWPYTRDGKRPPARSVLIGRSDTAGGWTDGETYIAVDRKMLDQIKRGPPGWIRLAALILHEYTHGDADTDTHVHDRDFYKTVHDAIIFSDALGKAVNAIEIGLYREARRGVGSLRTDDRREVIRRDGLHVATLEELAAAEDAERMVATPDDHDEDLDVAACPSGPGA